MKMWENLKKTCSINQKAQALMELAAFGAVLLFCLALLIHFGLQMNYQQNTQMQSFRKGLKMAYYKSGPSSQTSLTMIKDKPVVDPRDRWGFADRVPVGGSASVTWDNNLNSLLVGDVNENPQPQDLPKSYIEIDKTMRIDDSEVDDNIDNVLSQDKGVFTTAGDVYMACSGSTFGIYLDNPGYQVGSREYYMILRNANANEIKVFGYPDLQKYAAYKDDNGLIRTLSAVNLHPDPDDPRYTRYRQLQVNIFAVAGTKENCDDGYCGGLSRIRYLDPTAGDIDTYYTEVNPWDKDKTLEDKQGLIGDSQKNINYGSASIINTETPSTVSTTTTFNGTSMTLTHKLRLNRRRVRDVEVEFEPYNPEAYNWEASQ
jgi:hypothetical protein